MYSQRNVLQYVCKEVKQYKISILIIYLNDNDNNEMKDREGILP